MYVPHALPAPLMRAYEFFTSSDAAEVSTQLGDSMLIHADSVVSSAPITLTVLAFAGLLERYYAFVFVWESFHCSFFNTIQLYMLGCVGGAIQRSEEKWVVHSRVSSMIVMRFELIE